MGKSCGSGDKDVYVQHECHESGAQSETFFEQKSNSPPVPDSGLLLVMTEIHEQRQQRPVLKRKRPYCCDNAKDRKAWRQV